MNTEKNRAVFSDAHHPAKKYCEWWYFTFFYGPGDVAAGIFKIENNVPEIWIFVKESGQEAVYLRRKFPRKLFSASTEKCDVRIGENYFREVNGGYEINFDLGQVRLDVKFHRTIDWPDNIIERDLGEGEEVRWIVPCLKGEFSGTISVADKTKDIGGLAFHDHVWHNISQVKMYPDFKSWLWGINYSPDGFSLYAKVDFGPRRKFSFIFSLSGDARLRVIDDPRLLIDKSPDSSVIEISYQGKSLHRLKLFVKEPIYQWGNNFLVKFFIHKLLRISQYHCLGEEDDQPHNWDYLEILEKRP